MIPRLVVSRSPQKLDAYLEEYKHMHAIPESSLRVLVPAKDELGIEEVRRLKKELPYISDKPTVFVLSKFDTASLEAQNALLKTLEEKQTTHHFILLAATEEHILQTVLSRSKVVRLDTGGDVPQVRPELTVLLKNLPKEKNASFLNDPLLASLKKEEAALLIDEILLYYRQKLPILKTAAVEIMKKCVTLKGLILTNNIHVQLAVDNLLIFSWKMVRMKT